ncbi:hypothetical protein EDD11_009920 [Mortierella claussenii]|nr:hypothetical protein EDD11_009920 [Mortierella claussenii]
MTSGSPNISDYTYSLSLEQPLRSIRRARTTPSRFTLDDYNLVSLGYKPVMARILSGINMTGVAFTSSNVLCGVVALYGLPLTNGGPAWTTWSYLIVGIMSGIVSLCLAELAAAYPTAAGTHHWAFQLASTGQKPFLTWITGWLALAGSIASASSVAFYFSSILGQTLLSLHKISSTPGMLVMFHLGAVLFWQALNLLPVRGFSYISTVSVALNYGILHPIKGLLDDAIPAVRVIMLITTASPLNILLHAGPLDLYLRR